MDDSDDAQEPLPTDESADEVGPGGEDSPPGTASSSADAPDPGDLTWANMRRIVGTPTAFFESQRGYQSLGAPTLFVLGTALASLGIQTVCACIGSGSAPVGAELPLGLCLLVVVGVPIMIAGLLAASGVLHGCVRLVGCRGPFGLTYRAMVYSGLIATVATMVQQCLAIFGPYAVAAIILVGIVATVWFFGLLFVGLRAVHDLTSAQAAGAIVLMVLCFCVLTGALALWAYLAGVPIHLNLFGVDLGEVGK